MDVLTYDFRYDGKTSSGTPLTMKEKFEIESKIIRSQYWDEDNYEEAIDYLIMQTFFGKESGMIMNNLILICDFSNGHEVSFVVTGPSTVDVVVNYGEEIYEDISYYSPPTYLTNLYNLNTFEVAHITIANEDDILKDEIKYMMDKSGLDFFAMIAKLAMETSYGFYYPLTLSPHMVYSLLTQDIDYPTVDPEIEPTRKVGKRNG